MKKILRSGTPLWLSFLFWAFTLCAVGYTASVTYTGSFKVATSGHITDSNQSASTCAGYNSSNQLVSNGGGCTSNGVTSVGATSPITSSGGTTPTISISSTPTFSSVTGTVMYSDANASTAGPLAPCYVTSSPYGCNAGFKTVVVSGQLASGTSGCGPIGSNTYCFSVNLPTVAQFTSGGSSSAAPSFQCASGWSYSGSSYFEGTLGSGNGALITAMNDGSPNTIYVWSNTTPSVPFTFVCEGY